MAQVQEESHRAPSAKPHHGHNKSVSPEPSQEDTANHHKGVGIPRPFGLADSAWIDKDAKPTIAVKRYKSGDLVMMKTTRHKYTVSKAEYIDNGNYWQYYLKDDGTKVDYGHPVEEEKIQKVKKQKA